jgi:hypothetical protein
MEEKNETPKQIMAHEIGQDGHVRISWPQANILSSNDLAE